MQQQQLAQRGLEQRKTVLGITGGQSLLPIGVTGGKTGTRRSFIQSISKSVSLMNDSDLHMSDGGCKHDTHLHSAQYAILSTRGLWLKMSVL